MQGGQKTKKSAKRKKAETPRKHVLKVNVRGKKAASTHRTAGKNIVKIEEKKPAGTGTKSASGYVENSKAGYSEMVHKYKQMIIWSGVSFFMILIIFFWAVNIKKIIGSGIEEKAIDNSSFSELNEELSANLEAIKENLEDLKEIGDKTKDLKDYTQSVTSTLPQAADMQSDGSTRTSTIDNSGQDGDADEAAARQKLQELEGKLKAASTGKEASGTASGNK
jgi:hypothetical protein